MVTISLYQGRAPTLLTLEAHNRSHEDKQSQQTTPRFGNKVWRMPTSINECVADSFFIGAGYIVRVMGANTRNKAAYCHCGM
jgi:hypothetical protein